MATDIEQPDENDPDFNDEANANIGQAIVVVFILVWMLVTGIPSAIDFHRKMKRRQETDRAAA